MNHQNTFTRAFIKFFFVFIIASIEPLAHHMYVKNFSKKTEWYTKKNNAQLTKLTSPKNDATEKN